MTNERRVAIDSCVLVNYFTDGANDRQEWLPASKKVLQASEIRLVASALTLAEVAGAGNVRGNHIPTAERRQRIAKVRKWLDDHQRWLLVELDRRIARKAADLAIRHQLKGPDAVILASAIEGKADSLVTWDDGLLKLRDTPELGIKVVTPADLPLAQESIPDLVLE